jgi:hypothetical protein
VDMKLKEFWNVVEKSDSNHGEYERFARVNMSREMKKQNFSNLSIIF